MSTLLASLPYYGGKARGKGKWIASLLPKEHKVCYLEPFGGMFSVLLAREPSKYEMINDLNDRVINWARAVRDHPEEFGYLIENTPHSYKEFVFSLENVDNLELSPLQRAVAFHVIISQSVQKGDNAAPSNFRRVYAVNVGSLGKWRSERVMYLSERLFNVQLLCEDALGLLERTRDKNHMVIYCDPPYYTADTSAYRLNELDYDKMADVLLAQKGRVAVSGYGDEWDKLGWERHEKETRFYGIGQNASQKPSKRVEVLWTNYSLESQLTLDTR